MVRLKNMLLSLLSLGSIACSGQNGNGMETYDIRSTKTYIEAGGRRIYTEMNIPKCDGPMPLLIYSHGYGYNWEMVPLADIARHGIVTVFFDFPGGSPGSRSGGSSTEMSVMTEADDLELVLDYMRQFPQVDTSRVFLCGGSQGGFVSAVTGIRRQHDVAGLILCCPALVIMDFEQAYNHGKRVESRFRFGNMTVSDRYVRDLDGYDVYAEMAKFAGPVLIYHGDRDSMVPLSYSERAAKAFPNARLRILRGASHMLWIGNEAQIEREITTFIHTQAK